MLGFYTFQCFSLTGSSERQCQKLIFHHTFRKNGFNETDFFKKQTDRIIKITLGVDLTDRTVNDDSKHIISKVGGARTSDDLNNFFFQIQGEFDSSEGIGIPKLLWGNKIDDLIAVSQEGIFSPLDKLFKVVYVDPTIDLAMTFSKNRKRFFDQNKLDDNDIGLSEEIKELGIELNTKISSMNLIQSFQSTITNEYRKLKKENISIEMKSELSINGYFTNLVPYIRKDEDDNMYPTSGDGRKKILAYSLLNYLTQLQEEGKIIIYLIEEPENNLHRSMQIALSKQLFESKVYNYFFLSTHSSELLYEMDEASLIRIYSKDSISCESFIYRVDSEFKSLRKELNRSLSTALFAEKVLLVEGPSEKALFEKILEMIHPIYELDGGYILEVNGIKFEPYVKVLRGLNISVFIKTDNDLKAKKNHPTTFDIIGMQRCLNLLDSQERLEPVEIDYYHKRNGKKIFTNKTKLNKIKEKKLELYILYSDKIREMVKNNIYLSKLDLENDLHEALGNRLGELLDEKDPVKYLQEHKLLNMLELTTKLTEEDCRKIINHSLFRALRKLVPNEVSGSGR
ncbi:hypothetical protein PAESOLCIP111_06297 [Paenibacillus solanacearum]|uniref:AAA family ATPase n=1 Tax=Paenibacillus solanacearum TaxID=2048548 RepID=A0A916K914_9BACL|nr:hypothetical protein PAESOLCIP111_06297 [Paenibacillus solanacearum]